MSTLSSGSVKDTTKSVGQAATGVLNSLVGH
jgi:hypothetical protein